MKIMLVDDEPNIRSLVERIMNDDGHEFCYAEDGLSAFDIFNRESPDLIILDVMLPKMDGFETCRLLREQGVDVPIVFLSAKGDIVDKGTGFRVGGDDYLVKPFVPQEFSMRISAHVRAYGRRNTRIVGDQIKAGDLLMDTRHWRTNIGNRNVEMTPKEFRILALMASSPGEVFTREHLIEEVWGKEYVGETSSVAGFIRKIREKIEDDPAHPQRLVTVWHVGYKYCIQN